MLIYLIGIGITGIDSAVYSLLTIHYSLFFTRPSSAQSSSFATLLA